MASPATPFDQRTHLFKNNVTVRLAAALDNVATSCVVQSGQGAQIPTLGTNEIFVMTLDDITSGNREVVYVTDVSGDVLTIERAKEGTSARAWTENTLMQARITAGILEYLQWLYSGD